MCGPAGCGGLGVTPARRAEVARAVLAFETSLAAAQLGPAEQRDPAVYYNPRTTAELQEETGARLSWAAYLGALHADVRGAAPVPQPLIVSGPSYFAALEGILAATPVDTVLAYLQVRVPAARTSNQALGPSHSSAPAGRAVASAGRGGVAPLLRLRRRSL